MSPQKVSPRVRMRDTELKPADDALTPVARIAGLLFVVVAPVAAIVSVVTVVVLPRFRRVHPGLVALISAGLLVLAATTGGLRAFFTGWREVFALIGSVSGIETTKAAVGDLFTQEWTRWLLAQVPLSIPLGLLVGSLIALGRRRYSARWRKPEAKKKPAKTLNRATTKAPEWPQKKADTLDALMVRLGVDLYTGKPWDLPVSALRHHAFITGPSGFGKTTTIIEVLRGLLAAPAAQPYRVGITFVTMKPDAAITEALAALAELAGRGFHVVTHDGRGGSTTYNPLRHGTGAHRRNVLMEAEANAANGGFTEPHYQRTGSRFTLLALRALAVAVEHGQTYTVARASRPWRMDLEHLARMMRMEPLQAVMESGADPDLSADLDAYFREIAEDRATADGVGGMRSRFAVIAEGAAGQVLREAPDGVDLRESIRAGDVVVFNLDAARDMEASQYVANLAIADWTAAMSELGEEGWHKDAAGHQNRMQLLIVDEFSALGGAGLRGALERARSQGGAVMLASQSYGELAENSTHGFRASLITNTSVKLLHQVDEGAEELAGLVGTVKAHKETTQIFEDRDLLGSQTRASGQGSLREVDEFKVHPNTLKNLQPGEIVAMLRHPQTVAQVKVRRTPPETLAAQAAEHRRRVEKAAPAAPVTEETAPAERAHVVPEETAPTAPAEEVERPEEAEPIEQTAPVKEAAPAKAGGASAWVTAAAAATHAAPPVIEDDDGFVPLTDDDE